ncbi:uncharacterized protein L969DRAFT_17069 [Mixia osmundae IAM 14324]|uniref:Serine/threonine-protein kinase n=1 Tax=Mixia osmundae (strain CBS 9802 / IAM 14324 / JCM 22182 / KY 12970) TaxID=764103 RepID=G7E6G4_MIXOS|nr:uncharacterized protein L969DRAFT_17069 [Mixia osmundae IAM 14324]KEI40419.1 hypothetical protein L969DRAFT_17069 [Mixia osmundae IAM 14324]GAA98424.1 hypothetical protein E5Q_05110 [Mixia osmundae IAM 14324]
MAIDENVDPRARAIAMAGGRRAVSSGFMTSERTPAGGTHSTWREPRTHGQVKPKPAPLLQGGYTAGLFPLTTSSLLVGDRQPTNGKEQLHPSRPGLAQSRSSSKVSTKEARIEDALSDMNIGNVKQTDRDERALGKGRPPSMQPLGPIDNVVGHSPVRRLVSKGQTASGARAQAEVTPPQRKRSARASPQQTPQAAIHHQPVNKPVSKLTEAHGSPPRIIKRKDGAILKRGRMLGEGGFARVYEAFPTLASSPVVNHTPGSVDRIRIDKQGEVKAVKVVCKQQLKSAKNKAKLFTEIKLHQSMAHPNIVRFDDCYEDSSSVYMELEYCSLGSMNELLKRRKRYQEPEARYYLVQLIGACDYMHSRSVIHRDLKLGNIFLDGNMDLRVGDFGLAALVRFPGERKTTMCGTPNYIAPEVLYNSGSGHSFEVDVWSIGVILYTLIIGRPPFQTKEVKAIYDNILKTRYGYPENVAISDEAVDLISSILTSADQRPTLADILAHPFFTSGPFPPRIPTGAYHGLVDYSGITPRESADNFEALKRICSAHTSIPSQRTHSRSPVSEGRTPPKEPRIVPAPAVEQQAQAMEREVQKALAPDSPVSDLIKSARKPLMVSSQAAEFGSSRGQRNSRRTSASPGQSAAASPTGGKGAAAHADEPERAQRGLLRRAVTQPSPSKPSEVSPGQPTLAGSLRTVPTSLAGSVHSEAPLPAKEKKPAPTEAQKEAADLDSHGPTRIEQAGSGLYAAYASALGDALACDSPEAIEALPMLGAAAQQPRVFITSWIDYRHKYGLAYQLCDGTNAVQFNDNSSIVLSPDRSRFDYLFHRKGSNYVRCNYDKGSPPADLARRVSLLDYFQNYMNKVLERHEEYAFKDGRQKDMHFLVKYFRLEQAGVFRLSNGLVQFNFADHVKILLSSDAQIVHVIGKDYQLSSHTLRSIMTTAHSFGLLASIASASGSMQEGRQECSDLLQRLQTCCEMLTLISQRKTAPRA